MTDEIGKVYKDISYGDGDANKFDLYVPANGDKESCGILKNICQSANLFDYITLTLTKMSLYWLIFDLKKICSMFLQYT